jgi:hypothetical protein
MRRVRLSKGNAGENGCRSKLFLCQRRFVGAEARVGARPRRDVVAPRGDVAAAHDVVLSLRGIGARPGGKGAFLSRALVAPRCDVTSPHGETAAQGMDVLHPCVNKALVDRPLSGSQNPTMNGMSYTLTAFTAPTML